VVMIQSLADLRNLIGAETQLTGTTTGVTHIENPERMAFAPSTLWTTAGMMNGSFEQGSAQDVAEIGEAR